jgi:hypothetical protein
MAGFQRGYFQIPGRFSDPGALEISPRNREGNWKIWGVDWVGDTGGEWGVEIWSMVWRGAKTTD